MRTWLALSLLLALPVCAADWIDVSVPVEEGRTPVYAGDPPIHFTWAKDMSKGDIANVSRLEMGAHTGTHVDAPNHFIAGAPSVDELSPEVLIGPALVVECSPECRQIDAAELARHSWNGAKRLLFKTRSSYDNFYADSTFHTDFVAMTPEAAQQLVDGGVQLIGIDYQSIEPYGSAQPRTHRILLGHNVVVVEGLDLRRVSAGQYEFCCLPLRLKGREGAPARALLRTPEN